MKKGKGFALNGDSDNEDKKIGQGEFANMPQDVKMQAYPKTGIRDKGIPDDIKRIDKEVDQMEGKRSKYISNQH